MPSNPQAMALIPLLTHRSFLVRATTGMTLGTLVFFGMWAASLAWLPEGLFLALPRPSINSCLQNVQETLRAFLWNLVLAGGLTVFARLAVIEMMP